MFLRGVAVTGLGVPNAVKRLDGTAITSGTWTVYITKDGGTQATIAGSVTHEGNGQWTFNLTASEMDAGTIVLTYSHTDASPSTDRLVTAPWVSGTAQAGGSTTITLASGASATDGLYVGDAVCLLDGQARVITGYVGSTKVATVDRAWTTNPTSSSAYVILPAGAVLSQQTHSGVTIPTVTTTGTATAVTTVNGLAAGVITASSIANDAITAGKIAADAIGASELAADAVAEIQSGLATASALSTVAGYIDTEVAAIKAKTDALPASPAATGDIPSAATIAGQVRTELTTELGRIDADISSRLADADYAAPLDAAGTRAALGMAANDLDAQLDAIASGVGGISPPSATTIADAVLSRNVSNIEGSAPEHSLGTIVLATLESSIAAGVWTIRRTDGSTIHATKTVTSSASADPITGVS